MKRHLINTTRAIVEKLSEDTCIRCGGRMVHVGFKIYRCGHEEKPEDLV